MRTATLIAMSGILVLIVAIAPWIGDMRVTWSDVASRWSDAPTVEGRVFWDLRMPRVLMAAVAGAALAVAGSVFQATFRNPLADPFTLGISSGASVGAALSFHLGWNGLRFGMPLVTLAALAGATVSVLLVYGVASLRRRASTDTLLLAGISISFVCVAFVLMIEYLSREAVTNQTVRWLMGSVAFAGPRGLVNSLPLVLIGLGIVWYIRRDLDLLMMGELVAAGRGVSLSRTRAAAYFAASGMTAAVVAHCGPIAFVGLVVPHMVRAFGGPSHGFVLPAAALTGAALLVGCDLVAARAMDWIKGSPLQIPVGVVTNLIGGLFFLYLLLTRGRREGGAAGM